MCEYIILNTVIPGLFGWILGFIIIEIIEINFSYYFSVFIFKFKYFFSNKQDVESPKSSQFIIKANGNYGVKAYDNAEIKADENSEIYIYE